MCVMKYGMGEYGKKKKWETNLFSFFIMCHTHSRKAWSGRDRELLVIEKLACIKTLELIGVRTE